jgi:hypothetical protein
MDKEQSGNRNRAGQDPAAERTLKNQRGIPGVIREDIGIIRHLITRRS